MSTDAIEIRRAVATARRISPAADLDGFADVLIKSEVSVRVAKTVLFNEIAAATPPADHLTVFRRAPLARVLQADRRSL